MKVADLYIRVSTDEQAEKGYSQRSQEEMLLKYCNINSIQVRKVIFEDHSAKTFNRPQWIKLMSDLRREKGQTDLLLFLKWDRFSRNSCDAYQMIYELRKLGVEPQAIEQPLDLSVPENKMMLAFYLAAPEVENDRRALNVFHGMRRAKKDGRWMGTAPIGYKNKTDENSHKFIAPAEPNAGIMRWVFEEIERGQFNTEQIWEMAKLRGLQCSKNNFWTAIRNPVYCGKIFIPKYKDEEAHFVNGKHEPIISEALYYDVQDVLDGRKKKQRTKIMVDDHFPLRGFLICPQCGKLLTGSSSKGKYKYYPYYHCSSICGCRFGADNLNRLFVTELKKYVPHPMMVKLYKTAIGHIYKDKVKGQMDEYSQVLSELEGLNKELNTARKLMLKEEIEPSEYRALKAEYQPKIERLEAKLSNFSGRSNNIDEVLEKGISKLSQLDLIYQKGTTIAKRQIISSIYPEKLIFDGFNYRTPRVNEVIRVVSSLDAIFSENKNGTLLNFSAMSHKVTPQRFELWTH